MGRKEGRAPTSSATSISPRAFLSAAATQFSADEEREQRGEAAPGPIASDTVRQFFRFPRPSSSFSSRRYWRSAGHEPKGFSFTASNWWVIKSLPCRNDQRQRKMLKPNAATRFWGKLSCKRGKRKKKGGGVDITARAHASSGWRKREAPTQEGIFLLLLSLLGAISIPKLGCLGCNLSFGRRKRVLGAFRASERGLRWGWSPVLSGSSRSLSAFFGLQISYFSFVDHGFIMSTRLTHIFKRLAECAWALRHFFIWVFFSRTPGRETMDSKTNISNKALVLKWNMSKDWLERRARRSQHMNEKTEAVMNTLFKP